MNLSPGLLRRARRNWSDLASEFADVVPPLTPDQARMLEALARDSRDLLAKTEPRKAPAKALPGKSREQARTEKRAKHAAETATLRAIVFARAKQEAGQLFDTCELCRSRPAIELHHFESGAGRRRRMQAPANTAALCGPCHRQWHRAPEELREAVTAWARSYRYPLPSRLAKRAP